MTDYFQDAQWWKWFDSLTPEEREEHRQMMEAFYAREDRLDLQWVGVIEDAD